MGATQHMTNSSRSRRLDLQIHGVFKGMRLSAWPWHPGAHGHAASEAAFLQEEENGPFWPWSSQDKEVEKKPCFENYSVKFKLGAMHSWFEVPTCSQRPTWNGVAVKPSLKYCGQCAEGYKGFAEVHWNIPKCTAHMCLWPASADWANLINIGPKEGLPVHPTCAWGIVDELKTVYKYPYRAAGMGGVTDALGWQTANPVNWGRVLTGLYSEGGVGLAKAAAQSVAWGKRLSPDCNGARSKEKILEMPPRYQKDGKPMVTPISAVCWNNVIDFRDLWCHYKEYFDVTSEVACNENFKPIASGYL